MTLRIVTWNIQKGGGRRRGAISAVLRSLDPDIAVLQEATDPGVVVRLADELGSRPVGASRRSVALLSRVPLGEVRWRRLPTGRHVLAADVADARIRLLCVHLSAGMSGRGERRRAREMEALLAVADEQPGHERTLIAGDLNAIAPSDTPAIASLPLWIRVMLWADGGIGTAVVERALAERFDDAFRRFHPEASGATLPTRKPTVRLDYFLLGSGLVDGALSCDLGTAETANLAAASDHLPLVLVLDPSRQPAGARSADDGGAAASAFDAAPPRLST